MNTETSHITSLNTEEDLKLPKDFGIVAPRNSYTKEQKKTLFGLILSLTFMQTLYMNIATFLPLYITDKHSSITSGKTGVILCMFQLA